MKYILTLLLLVCVRYADAQCVENVKAFKPGEKLTYLAYYNWGFIWIHAGDVQFTVNQSTLQDRKTYFFEADGNSLKSYDWMYKVREKFQSHVEQETFNPIWFERNSTEGSYKAYENYVFSNPPGKIYSKVENSKKPFKKDSIKVPSCTFDVLSLVYYSRTIDFDKYKPKEKIPLKSIIDNEVCSLYLRYLGRETIKTRDDRKFRCIKFSAMLVEGTIFKGGEDMFIWVTDDDNRIPILVEAKILIGSVKAYINTIQGESHEIKAQVK
jgi:hypothetical protein